MTGVVVISGFDRGTDKLMIEVPLPAWAVSATRAISGVPVDDPDLVGAYPLTEDQVRQIAAVAQLVIDPAAFDWFIEAYADE